jgi:hypothetical protein
MVLNEVWAEAGLKRRDGTCHLHCLEERLGRELTVDDLAPVNSNNAIRFFLKKAS